MGDGGERDFSRFTNNPWHLFDVITEQIVYSGKMNFRMQNRAEPGVDIDLTGTDVWECDFSEFNTPGEYRLVVERVGSSYPFEIGEDQFETGNNIPDIIDEAL